VGAHLWQHHVLWLRLRKPNEMAMMWKPDDTPQAKAHKQVAYRMPGPEGPHTFSYVIAHAMHSLADGLSFEAIIGLGPPETPAADSWAEVQTALNTISRYYAEGKRPAARVAQKVKDAIDAAEEMSKKGTMLDTFDVKTFSLCMGARPGSDGVITWDDESPFLHPEIFTRLPVLADHTWSVAISNVRMTRPGPFPEIKIDCHQGKQCSALLDSGTSLLAVPKKIIELITQKVATLNSDCDFSRASPQIARERMQSIHLMKVPNVTKPGFRCASASASGSEGPRGPPRGSTPGAPPARNAPPQT